MKKNTWYHMALTIDNKSKKMNIYLDGKNILDQDKDEFMEVHPLFEKKCKDNWIYSKELMQKVADEGSLKNIDEFSEEMKQSFVTSHDIEPEWHILIQAAFQKHLRKFCSCLFA